MLGNSNVTLDKSKRASIFYSLFNVRAGDLGETSEGVGVVPDELFRQEWSNLWVSLFVSFPFTLPLFNDRDLDVFSQVVGDLLRVFSQFSQSFSVDRADGFTLGLTAVMTVE